MEARRTEDSPVEWYPDTLVSTDLQDVFYGRAMESAKPVHAFGESNSGTPADAVAGGGKLTVQRPDGSWDEIEEGQIFWNEQPTGENPLDAGTRPPLTTDDNIPAPNILHNPPCVDPEGQPVYVASELDFKGGVHPCKVAPHLWPNHCRVSYGGAEVPHKGNYDLLPFSTELMEFVDTTVLP
ncbi:hypothetical protein ONZ45_g7803 [Pleurotus djamor]|nr:hypothetical protein ONZ45_g7803 [Pleurotus djamor]